MARSSAAPSTSMSASSAPANLGAQAEVMPVPPSADLALSKTHPPVAFTTMKEMWELVSFQYKKLDEGSEFQYLTFGRVTPAQFESIEKRRTELRYHVRFTYFADIETLVVKLPGAAHETAHRTFSQRLQGFVLQMGIAYDEFVALGAQKYRSQYTSSKEADSSWLNQRIRSSPEAWPSLVVEAGMSESMLRLRSDARWWLEHSNRKVNIVLLIWIQPTRRRIKIEKWEPGRVPTTRSSARLNPSNAHPVQTAELDIDAQNTITGAPLVLEFQKIFDRPAVPPAEHDFVFTAQDLTDWAEVMWMGLP
jgi:hypothetical protein